MGSPLAQKMAVGTKVFKLPVATDQSFCYLTYIQFELLHLIVPSYERFVDGTQWDELAKYAVHRYELLPIFCSIQEFVATVL